ncbi:MAG: DUF1214 domain-containing protein [Acidimicrobiales bacterium]|nr:DUF1214 domain-containing protein [Acidimicrobiales bacterium]
MTTIVNLDNFARAETDRMIAAISGVAGGTNVVFHNRTFASLDQQTVIRENRDTLYTVCVIDISEGAALTMPDGGDRYLSAMIINQDHYINRVIHDAGTHALAVEEHGSGHVVAAIRILVDPNDDADLAAVNALQDQITVEAAAARPFELPDYDEASFTTTRNALLELSKGMRGYAGCFGRRSEVDPVRHLVGTASGWGGLPETEAYYVNVQPDLPVGEYSLTVGDVPVDAFWSVSLYNGDGFFEPNDQNRNSVNSVTAVRNDDGTTTVNFGGCRDGRVNCLPIMEGWNYLVRLYRPHTEVLDGTWTFPSID